MATSTTKNRSPNNEEDEVANDEDSNSVDVNKRNGKPSSTDVGASGKDLFENFFQLMSFIQGDPEESGDYDEDDEENSNDDGKFHDIY